MSIRFKKHHRIPIMLTMLMVSIWFYRPQLFNDPYAYILVDRDGEFLSGRIAGDGQWRFPPSATPISNKYMQCVIQFEDEGFYTHPGIDAPALMMSLWQWGTQHPKPKRGASTLTMQIARMLRKRTKASIADKVYEILIALTLESQYTKHELLKLYATHAPFGGNVVGIEAAAWRYFGKTPEELSWGEAATLAVLPNAPALIHPGKNQTILFNKRNQLLNKLLHAGIITLDEFTLAQDEPLPLAPAPLPQLAPHLLNRHIQENPLVNRIESTLQKSTQAHISQLVNQHSQQLAGNHIYNAAAIVADVETGQVIAYVGNANHAGETHQGAVDIVQSPRSTGSLLKPFLFAKMLDEGFITPWLLVKDTPLQINGFAPQNYFKTFDGAVQAQYALGRSLNIPSVNLLRQYGVFKFHQQLKKLGMNGLVFPAEHYGLALILGGAESSLWELCGMYASLGRILKHYTQQNGKYAPHDLHGLTTTFTSRPNQSELQNTPVWCSAAAIYQTFKAMENVARPDIAQFWSLFNQSQPIAWKTGTSFGNRDAWAIGVTADFVVGVWCGNADGEGRPQLTGIESAAPLLFQIFGSLPNSIPFDPPMDELIPYTLCSISGYPANAYCTHTTQQYILKSAQQLRNCPYHQLVHLDLSGHYQVRTDCAPNGYMKDTSWFTLPPIMAHFYAQKNPFYKPLPPLHPNCELEDVQWMDFIYPKDESIIYLPKNNLGELNPVVFEATHRLHDAVLYWFIDQQYVGSTQYKHTWKTVLAPGKHLLTIADQQGNTHKKWVTMSPRSN